MTKTGWKAVGPKLKRFVANPSQSTKVVAGAVSSVLSGKGPPKPTPVGDWSTNVKPVNILTTPVIGIAGTTAGLVGSLAGEALPEGSKAQKYVEAHPVATTAAVGAAVVAPAALAYGAVVAANAVGNLQVPGAPSAPRGSDGLPAGVQRSGDSGVAPVPSSGVAGPTVRAEPRPLERTSGGDKPQRKRSSRPRKGRVRASAGSSGGKRRSRTKPKSKPSRRRASKRKPSRRGKPSPSRKRSRAGRSSARRRDSAGRFVAS